MLVLLLPVTRCFLILFDPFQEEDMKVAKDKLSVVVTSIAVALFVAVLCCTPVPIHAVTSEESTPAAPGTVEQDIPTVAPEAPQSFILPPPAVAPPRSVGGPEPSAARRQLENALLNPEFAYNPRNLPDPFKPFIAPAEAPVTQPMAGEEDQETPPEPQRPLTPLQKMRISEIEAGLKAIMWGPLGRRAVIEDASGKGYIVGVGSPAGERNGVVTEIFNDHLVIQQEYWDKKEKRMVPQNTMVKLKKSK